MHNPEDQDQDPVLANNDEYTKGGEHGWVGNAIASYTIVFEDEAQLKRFYKFMKKCKRIYPYKRTIGEAIDLYLQEFVMNQDANN